jgi:co-chaperonin GroES (HSP10)
MKAIGKYIVIDPIEESNIKTEGGLILSDKQREDIRYRQATVVAVGTDVEALVTDDVIYYDKSSGFNIELNNKQYKIIKEFDVVVIL